MVIIKGKVIDEKCVHTYERRIDMLELMFFKTLNEKIDELNEISDYIKDKKLLIRCPVAIDYEEILKVEELSTRLYEGEHILLEDKSYRVEKVEATEKDIIYYIDKVARIEITDEDKAMERVSEFYNKTLNNLLKEKQAIEENKDKKGWKFWR